MASFVASCCAVWKGDIGVDVLRVQFFFLCGTCEPHLYLADACVLCMLVMVFGDKHLGGRGGNLLGFSVVVSLW